MFLKKKLNAQAINITHVNKLCVAEDSTNSSQIKSFILSETRPALEMLLDIRQKYTVYSHSLPVSFLLQGGKHHLPWELSGHALYRWYDEDGGKKLSEHHTEACVGWGNGHWKVLPLHQTNSNTLYLNPRFSFLFRFVSPIKRVKSIRSNWRKEIT